MVLYKLQFVGTVFMFTSTVLTTILVIVLLHAKLECDPSDPTRKPDSNSNTSYFYCSLSGKLVKTGCAYGRIFNETVLRCKSKDTDRDFEESDDPLAKPHRQAPSVCGNGRAWLQGGSPVSCNPQVSSCPQGFTCQLYSPAALYFCCSGGTPQQLGCPNDFTVYIESNTNQPRACTPPPASNSCPTGFGCVLVNNVRYQCCGRSWGCPFNTAAFINFQTASYQTCSVAGQVSNCPTGNLCQRSSKLNNLICCSNTGGGGGGITQCPNGGTPLVTNGVMFICSNVNRCPTNYACNTVNGQNVCCPTSASSQCAVGNPLTGVTCSATSPCRSGYDCIMGTTSTTPYCCPNEITVCNQPLSTGTYCGQTAQSRFHYNAATGQCTSFSYAGCGGNQNNFANQNQCDNFCVARMCRNGRPLRSGTVNQVCVMGSNTCPRTHTCQRPLFGPTNVYLCCPTAQTTCSQAMQPGNQCFNAAFTMLRYYYSPQTRTCSQLNFLGCAGNSNNFRTSQECINFCSRSVCMAGTPVQDPSGNLQICSNVTPCPSGYQCTASGTVSYCCPSATIVCLQPMSQGTACTGGSGQIQQYYYNSATRTCQLYTFLGCGGNSNRFDTSSKCETFCSTMIQGTCPGGLTPVYNTGTTTPRTCTINVPNTCPSGSNCMLSTSGQPICCQGTPACPVGYNPYYIPGTAQTVACNTGTSCPANYVCVASSNVNNMNLCCRSSSTICPNNLPSNGQTCTVNAINGCPSGYICLRPSITTPVTSGSCCQGLPQCSVGSNPYYIPGSTSQVQICSNGLSGCPGGFLCQSSTITGVSICCSNIGSTRCSNGQQPYIPPGSTIPQQCALGTNSCPTNYACQAGTTGQMVCCFVQPSATCANQRVPYYPPGSTVPQMCNQLQPNCPTGYACQASTIVGQFYCCPGRPGDTTAKCPSGTNAYLMSALPLACPAGSPNCPSGYCCIQSTKVGQYLCCSCTVDQYANCANGQVPYLLPGTVKRQLCNPQQNLCQTGYRCQTSSVPNTFVCCKSNVIDSNSLEICPPGQKPLLQANNKPLQCFPDVPRNCAFDHKCLYNNEKRIYYCCKAITGPGAVYCPAGRQAYIVPGSSIPRTCHTTLNPCPGNYGCQYSSSLGHSYCCNSGGTVIDGCPTGSRPLIVGVQVQTCNPLSNPACPIGYRCLYSIPFTRWQCCTYSVVARRPQKCLPGQVSLSGQCLTLMLPGENGCTYSEQCSLKVTETHCSGGYCICPSNKLVLNTQCVTFCPTGYINAVGRCMLLTNVPFLSDAESPDMVEINNGTVGGWCLNTVIKEQQCNVTNSECDKTLKCHCKEKFELRVINGEHLCVKIKEEIEKEVKNENEKEEKEKEKDKKENKDQSSEITR